MRHHPIEVPFAHGAEVLRRRKRNSVYAHYLSAVTVALREVTDVEAPVYLRVSKGGREEPKEYRSHDGETYVAARRTDGRPGAADLDWLRGEAKVHRDRVNAFGGARREQGVGDLGSLRADATVRLIVSDDEPKWADAIVEHAGSLLLVDGTVWERAHEPVLRLEVFGRPSVRIAPGGYFEANDYRMDQADMIPEVGPLGAEEGHRIEVTIPPFELLRPDLLFAPTLVAAVQRVQADVLGAACELGGGAPPAAFHRLQADGASMSEATIRRLPTDVEGSARLLVEGCEALQAMGSERSGRLRRKVDQILLRVDLEMNAPQEVASFRA